VLDNLLEKLRNGDNVGRRARRARPNTELRNSQLTPLNLDSLALAGTDTTVMALDMLAQLKSDGFDASSLTTPTSPTFPTRRRRRRPEIGSIHSEEWEAAESMSIPEVSEGQSPL
jgi:cytokinesis protein